MKILIELSKQIMENIEDLEICILAESYLSSETEEEEKDIQVLIEDEPKADELRAVLYAFYKIFTEPRELHIYKDTRGQEYTHPLDVKEVIETDKMLNWDITTAMIGRILKFDLNLEPGRRKNSGIPYYWGSNRRTVLRLKNLIELNQIKEEIPSEELAAAEMRLSQLDALEEQCNWSSPCPTNDERKARESWHRIMDAQSVFENQYC